MLREAISAINGGSSDERLGVLDHELVVWLGDLNYRLDEAQPLPAPPKPARPSSPGGGGAPPARGALGALLEAVGRGPAPDAPPAPDEAAEPPPPPGELGRARNEAVASLCAHARSRDELLALDQLRASMRAGAAFGGFEEGAIAFAPTYKYDLLARSADGYVASRCPAWTDRVLFRLAPAAETLAGIRGDARCVRYDAVQAARYSDHRPVHAYLLWELPALSAVPVVRQASDDAEQRPGARRSQPPLLG